MSGPVEGHRSKPRAPLSLPAAVPPSLDREGAGVPELALDFNRFFAMPTEHLTTRFFAYQARLALPEQHESPDAP